MIDINGKVPAIIGDITFPIIVPLFPKGRAISPALLYRDA